MKCLILFLMKNEVTIINLLLVVFADIVLCNDDIAVSIFTHSIRAHRMLLNHSRIVSGGS